MRVERSHGRDARGAKRAQSRRSFLSAASVVLCISAVNLLPAQCAAAQEPDRTGLVAAARLAGDYLVRMQLEDGSFHYSYDPVRDRVLKQAYNIVRHAGTVYSLFELYRATRESRYLVAARRGTSYLKAHLRPARERGAVYVLDSDSKAKLGACGLALVVFAHQMELDPGSADRESAEKLARMIMVMQRADGSFISYYSVRGDEPEDSVSLYYPGEAILGLLHLFRLTGDFRLLDAARRGATYLVEFQRRMEALPSDAWLIQVLEALYNMREQKSEKQNRGNQNRGDQKPGGKRPDAKRPDAKKSDASQTVDQKYAEHALDLAEAMMAKQYTANAPAGYAGGYGPGPPRTTPAAARAEGLLAAYRIARLTDDPRAPAIAAAIKASIRFQLSQQFNGGAIQGLADPERARGGFRESLDSMRIRIDYVQHNISSLLGAAYTLY